MRADVPNSPGELATWLNDRRVPVAPSSLVPVQLASEQLASEGEAAGVVLTEADVGRINSTRPTFLPRLSAEEIEARRMAVGQCPKCSGSLHEHELARVRQWMETANLDRIQWLVEEAREIVRERGEVLEGEGRVN